jgi:hypothetical protein
VRSRPALVMATAVIAAARSDDRGETWRQTHLTGPFDLRTAPNHRLGEYQGLAGLGSGFAAVATVAGPQTADGPSDIVFTTTGCGGNGH